MLRDYDQKLGAVGFVILGEGFLNAMLRSMAWLGITTVRPKTPIKIFDDPKLASAFARTEFQAVQFMPLLVFPQIILGGLFMPRDQMPDVLYAISDWLPLSHAIDAIQAVAAGDEGWDVAGPVLIVAAFAVAFLVLAPLTLRRRTP